MYNSYCVTEKTTRKQITGCGSAWLERLVWDQEVAGSNPVTPTSRVQFNGRTPAFQAGYVGSIPITRLMSLQLSWIEQRPSKPWVGGSNPFRLSRVFPVISYGGYSAVGQRARLWLWRPRVRIPVSTRISPELWFRGFYFFRLIWYLYIAIL